MIVDAIQTENVNMKIVLIRNACMVRVGNQNVLEAVVIALPHLKYQIVVVLLDV
jgi:hypothetical protein